MCCTSRVWTYPYFREETLCAVHHGCEHINILGRKPCAAYCGCEWPPTSVKKPYVLHIVGANGPLPQWRNLMCCILWVWMTPYFSEETLCVQHCGCEHTHTIYKKEILPRFVCFQTSTCLFSVSPLRRLWQNEADRCDYLLLLSAVWNDSR